MGLEMYALYELLSFYKKTVVEILNKIDANLAEAVDNYNTSKTTKSSLKKYEISSHMTSMLPHYMQILRTTEMMAANLSLKLNKVGCDVQPEKDKGLTNPFLRPDLQGRQENAPRQHFEINEVVDLANIPEISELVHPEMDFAPTKKFLFGETESDEFKQEIIAEDDTCDQNVESFSQIQNEASDVESDVLEPEVVTVDPNIKEESVEDLSVMQTTDSNTESALKAEMLTSVIHIKDETNDTVSSEDNEKNRNLEDQQTTQIAMQPMSNIRTRNNYISSEIPGQQPQGSCIQNSKISKKSKKSKTKFGSQQCEKGQVDKLENVQENRKTTVSSPGVPLKIKSPVVQKVPEERRYNWREEAVKCLMNETLKTTLSWRVSTPKNQNKPEKEKRSRGSSSIFEIPDEELSVGQTCTFTHIESPSEFYVLTDPTLLGNLENSLNEDMNRHQYVINKYKSKELAKNNLGKYCAAFLSDTRRWHRVKILDWMDEEPETVFVQLIDYGDKSYLSYKYIKNMSELYATIPKIAIRCHFAGIYPTDTQFADKWATASVDFFVGLSEMRKRTKFVVVFVLKEGNSYGVELNKENNPEGDSLGRLLAKSGHACEVETSNHLETVAEEEDFEESEAVPTEKIPQCRAFTKVVLPPVGATVEILITGYVSTCHFYAHILYKQRSGFYNDDFEQLHEQLKLNNMVETYESFEISPRIGEFVLVKERQEWFRGVCSENYGDDNFKIFLVDFGYSVVKNVDNLRQIKEEFLTVPFQAVECVLDNCQEKKRVAGDVSKNMFQTLMYMQGFCGVVLGCGEPLRIQLWDSNDMDMSHVLKQWGIAEEPSDHSKL